MTEEKPVRPWDLFNAKQPRAIEEVQDERMSI
jgi:hypothetical protein